MRGVTALAARPPDRRWKAHLAKGGPLYIEAQTILAAQTAAIRKLEELGITTGPRGVTVRRMEPIGMEE